MTRDNIIRKINLVLEDASNAQLKYLEMEIKKILPKKEFQELYEKHSTNYAHVNSDVGWREDIDEGNFGTIYRTP